MICHFLIRSSTSKQDFDLDSNLSKSCMAKQTLRRDKNHQTIARTQFIPLALKRYENQLLNQTKLDNPFTKHNS